MSLVIENAAFYDPEPEVESFPGLEKYLQISTQKWKRKRGPFSESRSANIFLGNFLRSVRGS